MKTAEEYRNKFNLSDISSDEVCLRCDDIDSAINEARKECIIECAKEVIGWKSADDTRKDILKLINELK